MVGKGQILSGLLDLVNKVGFYSEGQLLDGFLSGKWCELIYGSLSLLQHGLQWSSIEKNVPVRSPV